MGQAEGRRLVDCVNKDTTPIKPAGVRVVDSDSGTFLCEYLPEVGMIKVAHRDRIFLIDIARLTDLHGRGVRAVRATAVSQTKPLIEPDS